MKVFVGCADAAGTEILKEVVAEVKKTISDPAAVQELGCGYAEAEAAFSNDDFASGSSVRGIFLCPTGLDSSCRLNQKVGGCSFRFSYFRCACSGGSCCLGSQDEAMQMQYRK